MAAADLPSTPPLSSTPRTRITRLRERGRTDRQALHDLLADGLVAHVGVVREGRPVVVPSAYAVDPQGPDEAGSLYLHGSVGAGWLGRMDGAEVCVTVTELDGLVLARSAFHHSMNYRSAVVLGRARLVTDAAERLRALDAVVDQVVPGRAATLRPMTRKELAATVVLAVPLAEASVKERAGDAGDDDEDVAAGTWAGTLPLRRACDGVVSNPDSHDRVPDDVRRRAAHWA
ncbi:hypothetical protein SAMN04488570_0316 [Nocardioides scoriae]|uniref:Nitroimidazol reductase NimA, pyridoxamine 5'-phosphate oxidase superfamily n=1 Tax=Nocardioides scoriae TaxID=642780 RepID=A0A1H1LSB2_9ACTN|nr:pyridoxamine 5'-phosphate oxidase family protein [Nocardioides scoriae]SDR76669.1 hypothetical protein SAMN04488570_0316 [Nocardioides scoriae]